MENEKFTVELSKEDLRCPVCLLVPKSAPIFQCSNGHIHCHTCHIHPYLKSCPICREEITKGKGRSLVAERIIEKIPRRCAFHQDGCEEPENIPANLIDHEKDCKYRPLFNMDSFYEACERNQIDRVKGMIHDLVNRKLDFSDKKNEFLRSLACAVANGYKDIVKVFLDPLDTGSTSNYNEVLKSLIKNGKKLDDGKTLLHQACEFGHLEVVKLLLPFSEVNATTNTGQTPIMLACVFGIDRVVQFLLTKVQSHGIDLNVVDIFGNNAYHYGDEGWFVSSGTEDSDEVVRIQAPLEQEDLITF